ncbi:hypothetical protein TCAL_09581 [Tigriopus californicus]|uniref:Endonuclease V n=1 Tax=Tigriopus californicus TaxID=6832 RepID=A0A553PGT8_TIGCA|nr:endonuclease V-like [Tigriopus californicus]TRY76893.1 hypothetical protein TCAL_09581 [Tigriopus californicus]|eukprot:TCALIF_09581-PA protein Name:"Similar to ENDOV Endonuclease V (Homo sapiens)" AED:0.34 eAED:0.34 QI:0/-1/0/1/-1/1/1/0/277
MDHQSKLDNNVTARRAAWDLERENLQQRLILPEENAEEEKLEGSLPNLVGGVDLSFVPGDESGACAAYVICQAPNYQQIIWQRTRMITLTAPYIPGYLAFREAEPLAQLIQEQKTERPELTPEMLLVDGNGLLHPHRFGLACHLGVLVDLPCIGVAKNLFQMSDEGILRDQQYHTGVRDLREPGQVFPLMDTSGRILGLALKTTAQSSKPVFVSVGHRVTLNTAKRVVLAVSTYRVPEPIRHADMISREFIRQRVNAEKVFNALAKPPPDPSRLRAD